MLKTNSPQSNCRIVSSSKTIRCDGMLVRVSVSLAEQSPEDRVMKLKAALRWILEQTHFHKLPAVDAIANKCREALGE